MTKQDQYHTPVLAGEVCDALCRNRHGVFVDATLGGGGHFGLLAKNLLPGACLIGIDRDPDAIAWNREHQLQSNAKIIIEQARFSGLPQIMKKYSIEALDGVLLDLGVSSFQIDSVHRGFSFMQECDLDMRMNYTEGETAGELIGRMSEEELSNVLATFGEVHNAKRMAHTIKMYPSPVKTSNDLRECLVREYGDNLKYKVFAKAFMALRIAVNDELNELRRFLESVVNLLAERGRIAVIAYHSLEDRFVKEFFRSEEPHCVCPKEALFCTCGKPGRLKRVTKKPVVASNLEVEQNPRARSARLRVAERCIRGQA